MSSLLGARFVKLLRSIIQAKYILTKITRPSWRGCPTALVSAVLYWKGGACASVKVQYSQLNCLSTLQTTFRNAFPHLNYEN